MTRGLERNEDFLRLNPESGLGQLADETGGFLVRDTNDATPGFRRIQEDMRFHYLLSYTPTNDDLRRPLPHDRGEGGAAGRDRADAQGLLRRAAGVRGARARLRGARRWPSSTARRGRTRSP